MQMMLGRLFHAQLAVPCICDRKRPRLVEKDDTITFRKSSLRDPNSVVKIEWQQDFRNRNQDGSIPVFCKKGENQSG